ncbi:MAG: hypothetical protein WC627_12135 [Legionella sp.]|jgi:hypothetical protein
MKVYKVVIIGNTIQEIDFTNYKKFSGEVEPKILALHQAKRVFAIDTSVDKVLKEEITQLAHSYLGLEVKSTINLDGDIDDSFIFDYDLNTVKLEKLLNTHPTLKGLIGDKKIVDVCKYSDGYLVQAFDQNYIDSLNECKKLTDLKDVSDTQSMDASSGLSSMK